MYNNKQRCFFIIVWIISTSILAHCHVHSQNHKVRPRNGIRPPEGIHNKNLENNVRETKTKYHVDQRPRLPRKNTREIIKHVKSNHHPVSWSEDVKRKKKRRDKHNGHLSKDQLNMKLKVQKNKSFKKHRDRISEKTPREKNEGEHKKISITFPKTYHSTGLITLPYDGIMEPFEIWYAEEYSMSRIDYYHGVDKTFQRGDLEEYGVYIKEIPKHKIRVGNNNKNVKSCWYRPGRKHRVVKPQSIVPMDLRRFEIVGEEYRSGILTIKLRRYVKTGNLKNTYTLWLSKEKPHRPIRYEIEGFDILLGGYYDHYYLDYITFNDWNFDWKTMEIPKGSWCHDAASRAESRYFFNPMSEFVHRHDEIDKHRKHIEDEFKKYKRKHGKSYKDAKEHSKRRNIFKNNARFIRSKNREGLNYSLAVNHLADLTEEEFQAMNDLLNDEDEEYPDFMKDQFPNKDEVPMINHTEASQPLPVELDWREYGVMSTVRGQSRCGACWAFSTTGVLEAAYKIATGKDIKLSAQMLVDCTYGFKNYGCRGGWPWRAMQWVMKNGIATYKSYGRYLGQEGLCHCGDKDNCTILYPRSFMDIMKSNKTAMKINLATHGPVSVGINSSPRSFKFYRDGIYDDHDCDDNTQHSVIVVGYGKPSHGPKYWIVKNSWGPYWGKKGYMKIANDLDICGILASNGVVANFRENSRGFPFERMKKVVTPRHGDIEEKLKNDGFEPIFNPIPFR